MFSGLPAGNHHSYRLPALFFWQADSFLHEIHFPEQQGYLSFCCLLQVFQLREQSEVLLNRLDTGFSATKLVSISQITALISSVSPSAATFGFYRHLWEEIASVALSESISAISWFCLQFVRLQPAIRLIEPV